MIHYFDRTREPECEDDEMQAEVRRIRAQSVAVEFINPGETDVLMRQSNPKVVVIGKASYHPNLEFVVCYR